MGALIPVPVVLRVPGPSAGEVATRVSGAIASILDGFCGALALPVRAAVTVESLDTPATLPPWRLTIGGAAARLRRASLPAAAVMDPAVAALVGDLFANRALLVTDAVIDALAVSAPASAFAALAPPDRLALAREAAALGVRAERVLRAAAPAPADGVAGHDEPRWWALLEAALADAPALAYGVAAEAMPAEADGAAFAEPVYDLCGVLVPPLALTATLAPGCLRIRDLPSPAPVDADRPLSDILREAAADRLAPFVTWPALLARLLELAQERPRLVRMARARFSPAFLARTARALVRDGLALRDLAGFLEAMLDLRGATSADEIANIVLHAPAGTPATALALADGRFDPEDAADGVRRWWRRAITVRHAPDGNLAVQLLPQADEARIRAEGLAPGSGAHEALLALLDGHSEPILTSGDVRRRLADALAFERPDLAVLSYQELLPDVAITVTRRVEAPAAAAAP